MELRGSYEASNPDVGMGPFPNTLVRTELSNAELENEPSQSQIAELMQTVSARLR